MHEVQALRRLAVEMNENRLTIEQAEEGVRIITVFAKLGVPPEQYEDLVRVCGEVTEPHFVAAALRLRELERATGMSYENVVARFDELASEVPELQKRKDELDAERAKRAAALAEARGELERTNNQLLWQRKHAEAEKTRLKKELAATAGAG